MAEKMWLRVLIGLVLVCDASAMLSPIINSGDAVVYATIAKNMVLQHDWARLVLDGQDWLDKPHFPFWMTALSFRIGGVSELTYVLPGFLFHLLGALYTYRLAALFYRGETALLAVLLYVSAFNLLDSAIEIKAEAYLRGEIMAACYYWWRYHGDGRWPWLLGGSVWTGLAILTKGVFTLWTVGSGILAVLVYRQAFEVLFSRKWLWAVAGSLLCATPELWALKVQFGSPESGGWLHGIRFFFWDSQFGRFLNTGPIRNEYGSPFFMVQALLIGFLPWTAIFVRSLWERFRAFGRESPADREKIVFLVASFGGSFAMFCATRFQMSYYIDILLPFAAILCARSLCARDIPRGLLWIQGSLVALVAVAVIGIAIAVARLDLAAAATGWAAVVGAVGVGTRERSLLLRVVARPALASAGAFAFLALLSAVTFSRVGVAPVAVRLLDRPSRAPIYVYRMPEVARELALYVDAPVRPLDEWSALPSHGEPFRVIARDSDAVRAVAPALRTVAVLPLAVHRTGTFDRLLKWARGNGPLESVRFLSMP